MTFSKYRTEFRRRTHKFIHKSLGTIIESDNKLVDLKPDTSLNDFLSFEDFTLVLESEKEAQQIWNVFTKRPHFTY
jgi:hypothetical protein